MTTDLKSETNDSRRSILGRIAAIIDSIIVICIALGQFVISLYGVYALFITAKTAHPFIAIPYVLVGLVSASVLLFCQLIAQIVAVAWQAVLVSTIMILANPASASDRFLRERVVWIIPAILYLLLSATIQWRRKEKINSA